jgi:hypothetical protein
MANVILTSGMAAMPEPTPPVEGPRMAEQEYIFPKWYFSSQNVGGEHYGGRLFETAEDFEAAGGKSIWFPTPQAAEAAAKTPPASAPEEGESHTPRSRR